MYRYTFYFLAILAGFLSSCANPVAPTGGPSDTTPPRLIPEASTPNGQKNYIPRVMELTFDEYVQLKNPARNVVISPPVKEKPDFSLRGRTLRIDWSNADTLRSATTYTLNFSNAIEDLNEGNPVEDLVLAFSTGPFLDSLTWSVKILGPKQEPQEKITVMLYEDLRDSVVRNDLPYYFAITDKQGIATFQYLKEGTYKVFAIKDDNLNLSYDLDNELIAFSEQPLLLPADSSAIEEMRLFLPEPVYNLAAPPMTSQMKTTFVFNPLDPYAELYPGESEVILTEEWIQDTLAFWWKEAGGDSTEFIWNKEDTTLAYRVSAPDSLPQIPIVPIEKSLSFKGGTALIAWKSPMSPPSDSSFFRKDTSGNICYFPVVEHRFFSTVLKLPQKECAGPTTIFALPGSLRNAYGQTHQDTLSWNFSVVEEENLASIQLLFTKGDSMKAYIVRLWNKDRLVFEDYLTGATVYDRVLEFLDPGSYSVEIVEDQNFNGHQDGGNYWKSRQPEWGRRLPLDQLRANWILDEEIPLENESTSRKSG